MKKNIFLAMILFLVIISGCSVVNKEKEVMNLKGESEHWKVEYVIRDAEEDQPYMIQCYIRLKEESLVINDLFFDIDSPGVVSHFGGTMIAENNESVLNNNLISPSISSYFLPEKGEDIVVTIRWNKNDEEKIILTP